MGRASRRKRGGTYRTVTCADCGEPMAFFYLPAETVTREQLREVQVGCSAPRPGARDRFMRPAPAGRCQGHGRESHRASV